MRVRKFAVAVCCTPLQGNRSIHSNHKERTLGPPSVPPSWNGLVSPESGDGSSVPPPWDEILPPNSGENGPFEGRRTEGRTRTTPVEQTGFPGIRGRPVRSTHLDTTLSPDSGETGLF